jgi:hypothetical protein
MPAILWNIYESERQGMTRELVDRFKQRAIADGTSPTAALVRLLTQYAAHGFPDESATKTTQPK